MLAVQQEAKDYATSAAAIPDTFPELERLHGQYESKMVQLGREQGPRLKKLLGSYRKLLKDHQKELTRQDKIKEAVAMNGEVAQVETELREVTKKIAKLARDLREGGFSTPSTIGEELKTNPFLRCENEEIRNNVKRRDGANDLTPVSVFRALRRFKDEF